MTSQFERFLDELEAERRGPAKPGAPGQPVAAPGGQLEAVMSDSGLFDANAMVAGKAKAPSAKPPPTKTPPAKTPPTSVPPGVSVDSGGMEAVMSDSGLFDANAMVPAAKVQPPVGVGRPGTAPTSSPGSEPSGKRTQSSPPDTLRTGGPGVVLQGAHSTGANRGAPLPPPPPAMHKPPSLSRRAPSASNSEPVMSDSGLFDVRELMAEKSSANAPSRVAGPQVAAQHAGISAHPGISQPGSPPGITPGSPPGSLPGSLPGFVGPASSSRTGPSKPAANPLAALAGRPGGKMPTIDDNPIMSDSGLFDVREMIPDYGGKTAGRAAAPPGSVTPGPVTPGPVTPGPVPPGPVPPGPVPRQASSILPAGHASSAGAMASRTGMKPASVVSELSRSTTMRAASPEGSKTSIKPITTASLGGQSAGVGELSRSRMPNATGGARPANPANLANVGSGSSGRLSPAKPPAGVSVPEPAVMSNTHEYNNPEGSSNNIVLLVVLLVLVLVGGGAAAFFMGVL